MITFTPTQEQQMLVESVRRYAEQHVRKAAHEADEHSNPPADVIAKGWGLGVLPGLIPEEYGGYSEQPSTVTGVLALEELAWGDLGIALSLWAPSIFALAVLISGTEAQKKSFLPGFCNSERLIMTSACIEPAVTFDPWRPVTMATRQNGNVILDGEKTYVPMASDAEQIIVYARDSETGKVDGYLTKKDTPGLDICERNQLMGIRAFPTFRIKLSGVTLPMDSLLGGEDGTNYSVILNRSRIALGAMAVGVARAAFEYARDYARERVQFGVPIATKQAIAFRLADVAIEVDAARLLVWETAWKADQENDLTQDAVVLKHYISGMALFATDSSVQILGGHGYVRDHPVEGWLRNARGFAAFDGLALV